jgi:hypothetical protein
MVFERHEDVIAEFGEYARRGDLEELIVGLRSSGGREVT